MSGTVPSSKEDLIGFAEDRIFSLGSRDLGSALSYKNMCYGLGKMIYALDDEDVHCVLAPDASITRNKGRWLSGFGYGGVIRWNDPDVAFPELRPNACGMLFMRLDELPDKERLVEKASEVNEIDLTLDGVKIDPDFGKGNHFFEFYEPREIKEDSKFLSSDSYFAILHCSAPELKDEVYSFIDKGTRVKTPLGEITKLEGEEAEDYYEKWNRLKSFSKRRRELMAEEILDSYGTISNYIHQGLFSRTEVRLGCYDTEDESDGNNLYPLTLRWDCPVYIFRGKENLSEKVIEGLGFVERAEKLGLMESLRNVNILPHGGGYDPKLSYQSVDVIETDFGNVFTLSDPKMPESAGEGGDVDEISKFGEVSITNPRELPYSYRGKGVARKVLEFELSDLVAKLEPRLTLKI